MYSNYVYHYSDPNFYPNYPYKTKPWNKPIYPPIPPQVTNTIICHYCGNDSGIPNNLMMVIQPPGLRCQCCGQIIIMATQTWC